MKKYIFYPVIGLVMLIMMLVFYSFFSLYQKNTYSIENLKKETLKQESLNNMYHSARERTVILLLMSKENDYFVLDELYSDFWKHAFLFSRSQKFLYQLDEDIKTVELLHNLEELTSKTSAIMNRVADLFMSEENTLANKLFNETAIIKQNLILKNIQELITIHQNHIDSFDAKQNQDFENTGLDILYLALFLALIVIVFLIYYSILLLIKGQTLLANKSEAIVNAINDAIFYLDLDGNILEVNDYAISLFSLDKTTIIGRHIDDVYDVYDASSKELINAQFKEAVKDFKFSSLRNRLILRLTQQEQYLTVQDTLNGVYDKSNRLIAYVLYIKDISLVELNRKRLEDERKRYFTIFDSANEGMITFSDEGIVTSLNRALAVILRYESSEILGKNIADLFKSDNLNIFINQSGVSFKLLISPFVSTKVNLMGKRKTGRCIHLTMSIADTEIHGDKRYSAIIRDITKEVNLKEQNNIQTQFLHDEKVRYSALFDTAADAMITISDRGLISSFNQAAENIFQYSSREVLGKNINILMLDMDAKYHDEYLSKYHETGINKIVGISREVKGKRKDGTEVPLLLSVADTGIKGEKRFSGILRNITAQKFAERMLNKAVRVAESALLTKSKFLDTMSHEIRTPLNGVLGMGQLLEATNLTIEQRAYVQSMNNSGKHLLELINDILDYSKLDAHMMTIEQKPFNLEEVCLNSLSILTGRSNIHQIDLMFDYDANCPNFFIGDSVRFLQILNNLLSNAYKFTQNGFICLSVNYTNNYLTISVEDSGIGIPKEAHKHLFKEFIQADEGTTREYGGTGLGLAITEKFIHLMKGQISLTSEVGEGSKFTVKIPINKVDDIDLINQSLTLSSKSPDSKVIKPYLLEDKIIYLLSTNKIYIDILLKFFNGIQCTIVSFPNLASLLDKNPALSAENQNKLCELLLIDNNLPEQELINLDELFNQSRRLFTEHVILLSSLAQLNRHSIHKYKYIDACFNKLMSRYDFFDALENVLNHTNEIDCVGFANLNAIINGEVSCRYTNAHVLVVDDIISNQYIASQFLEKYDIQVTMANNGKEAVNYWNEHTFDMIFMDCRMPVMDGYEATKIIREQETSSSVPIIAMTANSASSDHFKCRQSGMNDLLMKPFHRTEFEQILECYLASYQQVVKNEKVAIDENKEILSLNVSEINSTSDNINLSKTYIDEEVILMLSQDMSEAFPKIIAIIKTSLNELFFSLINAFDEIEYEELIHLVHSIKSPSANIGAVVVNQLASEIEIMLENTTEVEMDRDNINEHIQQMKREYEKTLIELDTYL